MPTKIQTAALTAALAIMTTVSPMAEAATRYGLACIRNETRTTIRYSVKWGDREWQRMTVSPGDWKSHYWRYESADRPRSPDLRVRFDSDLSNGDFFIEYLLKKFASPSADCDHYGRSYAFEYDDRGRSYIDLQER